MDRGYITPISELAQRAREHYEEAALSLNHWSSLIPQAIDAWEREQKYGKRFRLILFRFEFNIFIRKHDASR